MELWKLLYLMIFVSLDIRRPYSRIPVQDKQEGSKNKDNDEEDNWEIPEGDIPY